MRTELHGASENGTSNCIARFVVNEIIVVTAETGDLWPPVVGKIVDVVLAEDDRQTSHAKVGEIARRGMDRRVADVAVVEDVPVTVARVVMGVSGVVYVQAVVVSVMKPDNVTQVIEVVDE